MSEYEERFCEYILERVREDKIEEAKLILADCFVDRSSKKTEENMGKIVELLRKEVREEYNRKMRESLSRLAKNSLFINIK